MSTATLTRVQPVQQRAVTRLERITAAARQAIADHGRDGFTTAHVAHIAGSAIGTVYRYFADRGAILDALYPNRIQGLGDPVEPIADRVWIVTTDDGVAGVFTTEELARAHATVIGETINTTVEWTWLLGTADPALAELPIETGTGS